MSYKRFKSRFESDEDSEWIAISPLRRDVPQSSITFQNPPPSFDESQYDIILRRQRVRPATGPSLKSTVPSRFLNLSNDFEFAGWGTFNKIQLQDADYVVGEAQVKKKNDMKILGQYTASGLAGNDILGSIFYTLPAVVAVSSVYSPISLFISTMTLFVWRPIMEELGSAYPISGAPYSYILNISKKSIALLSAALLFLDFASTAIVSAATATAYLSGEVSNFPIPQFVGVILVLVIFTVISLAGVKESTRVAFCILSLHLITMTILIIAGIVHWAKIGNAQIAQNWHDGKASSASEIAREIFYGTCLGMLSLTGFECTPAYIARIKSGSLPQVMRNLHYPAIILYCIVMTLVLAVVPLERILQGTNVLSVLAEKSVSKDFRTFVVVDAVIVLCGGVLTGIVSACELLQQLSLDRLIPKTFCKVIPITNAPYISIFFFVGFSGVVYASTGASLDIISKMFSLVWLVVMSLFPLALLLLKFNRGRLPRTPRTSLSLIVFALILVLVIFSGIIVIDPITAAYFCGFTIVVATFLSATQNKACLLRCLFWIYDQFPSLHRWSMTETLGDKLIKLMITLKRQPVCILVKTDEINHLFHMMLYVRDNEETTCVKIVHFFDEEINVPSELEANARILDEAFPEITIDLIIVPGEFNPVNVATLAHHIDIPPSLMFMSCPGPHFKYSVAELGTRTITL